MSELQDLTGKMMLDAVDFDTQEFELWARSEDMERCSVCRFRLNGTIYVAVEDPSDGYRSSLRELVVQPDATMHNVFPPIEVVGVYRNRKDFGSSDILELIDTANGKTVLEVGTENTGDYYPSFVASFHPENMNANSEVKP
ncbi:hypothetical protein IB244_31610 [Rhizobium sp. RHZ02]|uniref:hypothetical protein n=1 Tax=Rhizobium sp. RHZ02 TaxID=2769306 RepID=UPI00178477F3|nr:hypothetical protein [Rhizobium sp. RHZ02]MBD9456011.1 hypothetical protein [Rhizobium sp. RHZ02]